jgi:serine/threonine-protein kinase
MHKPTTAIKARQKLGKYRLERRLGEGAFAVVYQALDTIEGVRVALKIPYPHLLTEDLLECFRREVRLAAQLQHPHILQVKNADLVDGHFVIAFPLGERALADRLQHRLSFAVALDFAEQMLDAAAFAHDHRIIHCDIKPENLILFPDNQLMLSDFGIAKVALRTIRASGSGTVGYVAPEQAMGKPSLRSDVFSLGLILCRMLSGQLPEWPYEWPPPGYDRLRRLHPDLLALVRRSVEVDPRKRFANAGQMLSALERVRPRALAYGGKKASGTRSGSNGRERDWQTVRRRQFQKRFGQLLETNYGCNACQGPVSEAMQYCPWCGVKRKVQSDETRFALQCPRCHRGLKRDWVYCPWCYGPGFEVTTTRHYSDRRYLGRCANPRCTRQQLMPFMRYCPWCHRKVRRRWMIPESNARCASCGWGVVTGFWSYCPWCGKSLAR